MDATRGPSRPVAGLGLPIPAGAPLLAVVAHPDDESFGLGALLAGLVADGHRVRLVCLTHGERSTLGAGRSLADVRRLELADAGALLGLAAVYLEGFPDGALAEVPPAQLDRVVAGRLGDARAVVAFERSGVTGHPDHQAATAAAERVAARAGIPLVEWGVPPDVADRLNAEVGSRFSGLAGGPGVVDIAVDRTAQRAAMACHRSQLDGNPVPARRLALQGARERVRVRVPQAGMASPATRGQRL